MVLRALVDNGKFSWYHLFTDTTERQGRFVTLVELLTQLDYDNRTRRATLEVRILLQCVMRLLRSPGTNSVPRRLLREY